MMNYMQTPYQQIYQNHPVQQQMFQPYQTNTIAGKIINRDEDINVNDIPMDGSVAIFPKADYSEIEARQWNSNGTISKIVFKPIQTDNPSNSTLEEEKLKYEEISKQFEGVFSKLDELSVAVGKLSAPKSRTVAKKEADE